MTQSGHDDPAALFFGDQSRTQVRVISQAFLRGMEQPRLFNTASEKV
jgi:hypothetical protein